MSGKCLEADRKEKFDLLFRKVLKKSKIIYIVKERIMPQTCN